MVSQLLDFNRNGRDAFTTLIKATEQKRQSFLFHHYETESKICKQVDIQNLSYKFANHCFGISDEFGRDIQNYLANTDINNVSFGYTDLSEPYFNNKIPEHLVDRIISENDQVLEYFKMPIPPNIDDFDYSAEIYQLYTKYKNNDPDFEESFNKFLSDHQDMIIVLNAFAQVLSCLCLSQSFYVYSYIAKKHPIISELFEFLIICNTDKIDTQPFVVLAQRYTNVFVGNLSLRVFGKENKFRLSQICDLSEIE